MRTTYLEKQLLGCYMKDNSLLKETIIQPHHFETPNDFIYQEMQKMANEGKAVDRITLLTKCYDKLSEIGGPDYITGIETEGNLENFESYELDLIGIYKDREAERISKNFISNKDRDIQELIREMQKLDDEGVADESNTFSILGDMLNEPYEPESKNMTGIPSGLKAVDNLTGGWQPTDSIIIGARPSMGKTALMLKFKRAAMDNGDVPITFSLEMGEKSLLKRLVTAKANINSFLARTPQKLTEAQKKEWTKAVGELSNKEFEVWDKPMQTVQYIRSKVRKAKKKYPGKRLLILIDYLTLINNTGKFPSDHAKVSDISARLKAIAKEYDCPVITLAQLSRGVEKREDKHPMLSDLRESGSIEQDADVIAFLYRESYYKKDTPNQNILEIDIAKQREGPTGKVEVEYHRGTGVIKDL